MKVVLGLACLLTAAVSLVALQMGLGRHLLWVTVQACALDQKIFNHAAPCLVVKTDKDYVILRNPADKSHFVLTPTVRIVGIEAPALRRPEAAAYLQEAWANRRLAYPDGSAVPDRAMGIAINSQRGRTQDQLHIHVDCALPVVQSRLAALSQDLRIGQWLPARLSDPAPYWVTALQGDSLEGINVVDLSATFLKLSERQMPQLTLAVFAGTTDPRQPNFILVARRDLYRQHAELLLDHDCEDYRRSTRTKAATAPH